MRTHVPIIISMGGWLDMFYVGISDTFNVPPSLSSPEHTLLFSLSHLGHIIPCKASICCSVPDTAESVICCRRIADWCADYAGGGEKKKKEEEEGETFQAKKRQADGEGRRRRTSAAAREGEEQERTLKC
jgi:hypothetical protein